MEGNDNQPSTRCQALGQRVGQCTLQVHQLVVDGDPQCLEDSRGRMPTAATTADCRLDRFGKIPTRTDRRLATSTDQCPGNLRTLALLAPQPQALLQFPLLHRCQQLPRRTTHRYVKPQIQRTVVSKCKASTLVTKLIRRQTQVQQDAVHQTARPIVGRQNRLEVRITGLVQAVTGMVKHPSSSLKHRGVTIESE
jgi:hypothetical protein